MKGDLNLNLNLYISELEMGVLQMQHPKIQRVAGGIQSKVKSNGQLNIKNIRVSEKGHKKHWRLADILYNR